MHVSVWLGTALVALTVAAPAPAQQAKPAQSIYDLLGIKPPGLRGAALDAAVARASGFPLGSDQNPVRAEGVAGENAYLARLRCSDRRPPQVRGRTIGPPSPFGGVTDVFTLQCAGQPATAAITIDMYHETIETRAVPGFTIVER